MAIEKVRGKGLSIATQKEFIGCIWEQHSTFLAYNMLHIVVNNFRMGFILSGKYVLASSSQLNGPQKDPEHGF